MKFFVEQWQPEFGGSVEDFDGAEISQQDLDLAVEMDPAQWRPVGPKAGAALRPVSFIDGVRRIDARLFVESASGGSWAICASCAAGITRCDDDAKIEYALTQRYVIGPKLEQNVITRHGTYEPVSVVSDRTDFLMNGLAQALSNLEATVAEQSTGNCLMVMDGPLRGRERIPNAIGYIKSHHASYLRDEQATILTALQPGERTPVFLVKTSWTRYSWYMRLPNSRGHAWAGIVRCEAQPSLSKYQAIDLADTVTATLPAFASAPHKDGRAPQNLYPIKGLEEYLRRRLGDAELMYRSISLASDYNA